MSDLTDIANQDRPLSYVSWLQLYRKNAVSEQIALSEYNQYVHDWHNTQTEKAESDVSTITDLYKNLFKEITLHFTTEEERRFLSNIDLDNKKDLDIAVPFFVKKLKQISQYFVAKREEAKQAKVKYNFNGSSLGLEKQIQFTIFNLISNQDFTSQFLITTVIPALSTVIAEMDVTIDGLYDTTTTYFDKVSGNNDITPLPILDLNQAIVELLESIPLAISSDPDGQILLTSDNEEILVTIPRNNIQDLPYSEFLNAIKRIENLNMVFQQRMFEKFMGTEFFYLSTGSTTSDVVSGSLFTPTNAHANILNRYKPTEVTVPNDTNLKTLQEIGSYFTPDKLGLLSYVSFTHDYSIATDTLSANTIYIFPDPTIYGPGRGNTRTDQVSPISHRESILVIRADGSNQQLNGDIVDTQYHQKHYPYQSREETLKYTPAGISRSYDAIDFFTGTEKDIWANPDVYPVKPLETPPFQQRIDDLIVTDDTMVQWRSDIFGNEFALYKKVEPKRVFNIVSAENYYSTRYEDPNTVRTFSNDTSNLPSALSLNDKLNALGVIQVRSSHTPTVDTISNVLSNVFVKYQSEPQLLTELVSAVKYFDIANDIIIIQTDTYIVMEKYSYDFTTGIYKSVTGKKIFLQLKSNVYHINYIFDNLVTIGNQARASWVTGLSVGPLTGRMLWNTHMSAGSSHSILWTVRNSVSGLSAARDLLWSDYSAVGDTGEIIFNTDSFILNPLANAWADRVEANGGIRPSATSIDAAAKFCNDLVTLGLSSSAGSKIKTVNIMAYDNSVAARTPLIPGSAGTFWGFQAGNAIILTHDGVASQVQIIPCTPADVSTSTSGGVVLYLSAAAVNPQQEVEIGVTSQIRDFTFLTQSESNTATGAFGRFVFNESATSHTFYAVPSATPIKGYISFMRTSLNQVDVYFGNKTTAHAAVFSSNAIPSLAPSNDAAIRFFGTWTPTDGAIAASFKSIAFMAFTDGLTQTESSLLHKAVTALRFNLGGMVY